MTKKSQYPRTGLLGWLCTFKWEGMRAVDRANERRVNLLAMVWAASLIGATAIVQFLEFSPPFSWAMAAIPTLFGFLCLRAYLKLLREADEMLRQIQFEAMATGFGTGVIIGMAGLVIDLPSPWQGTIIVTSMFVAFSVRVILAAREVAKDAAQTIEGDPSE